MKILALDPAVNMGFAIGETGAVPRSGAMRLKKPSQPPDIALHTFYARVRATLRAEELDLVVIEHYLDPKYSKGSFAAVMGCQWYAIASCLCAEYKVHMISPYPAKVRKFFIGVPRMEDRKETKRAVIIRCHQLGLMPDCCWDDNRADSISLWCWAEHVYAHDFMKGTENEISGRD